MTTLPTSMSSAISSPSAVSDLRVFPRREFNHPRRCRLAPQAFECGDGDAGPVTIAVAYHPQDSVWFATGIPGYTADLGQFFGNALNFFLGHFASP